MSCCHHHPPVFGRRLSLHDFVICFLILVISTCTSPSSSSSSSQFRLLSHAQGRKLPAPADDHNVKRVNEEKILFLRAQIGSRPPTCERRCSSCPHCEAIQVPTNPTTKNRLKNSTTDDHDHHVAAIDDDTSNYKPISWKCKCGHRIFNP